MDVKLLTVEHQHIIWDTCKIDQLPDPTVHCLFAMLGDRYATRERNLKVIAALELISSVQRCRLDLPSDSPTLKVSHCRSLKFKFEENLVFQEEIPECEYIFHWRTSSACPRKYNGTNLNFRKIQFFKKKLQNASTFLSGELPALAHKRYINSAECLNSSVSFIDN